MNARTPDNALRAPEAHDHDGSARMSPPTLSTDISHKAGALGFDRPTSDTLLPLQYELRGTLRELSAAARSIRTLSDYLDRHPDALVFGKGGAEGK